MLVFTLYWRATTDTEAPGAAAAATISRLSASGQDLCRRLGPAFVSIIEFVDTSHTTNIIMQASIGAHRLHRKAALTGGIRFNLIASRSSRGDERPLMWLGLFVPVDGGKWV